jgi:hypothetical protein
MNSTDLSVLKSIITDTALQAANNSALCSLILKPIYNSAFGVLFGFFVYGIDSKTTSAIIRPALAYSFISAISGRLQSLVTSIIAPDASPLAKTILSNLVSLLQLFVIALLCYSFARYELGDGKKFQLIDGLVSIAIQDVPSFEIMQTAILLLSQSLSLLLSVGPVKRAMAYFGIDRAKDTIESPACSKLVELDSQQSAATSIIGSTKSFVLLAAILASGLIVKGKEADPEKARFHSVTKKRFLGYNLDLDQLQRATLSGLYVFSESFLVERQPLKTSLILTFLFETAYNAYYVMRSKDFRGQVTNFVGGILFGLFFPNGSAACPSDVAALAMIAPSSGVIRTAYYVVKSSQSRSSRVDKCLQMLSMIVCYASGVMVGSKIVYPLLEKLPLPYETDSLGKRFTSALTIVPIIASLLIADNGKKASASKKPPVVAKKQEDTQKSKRTEEEKLRRKAAYEERVRQERLKAGSITETIYSTENQI